MLAPRDVRAAVYAAGLAGRDARVTVSGMGADSPWSFRVRIPLASARYAGLSEDDRTTAGQQARSHAELALGRQLGGRRCRIGDVNLGRSVATIILHT